jgi:hypothetical protein
MKSATQIKITVSAKDGCFLAVSEEGYAYSGRYGSLFLMPEERATCGKSFRGGYTLATSATGDTPQEAHDALLATLQAGEQKARAWNEALDTRLVAAREFNERGFAAELLSLYRAGKLFTNDGNGAKKLVL